MSKLLKKEHKSEENSQYIAQLAKALVALEARVKALEEA